MHIAIVYAIVDDRIIMQSIKNEGFLELRQPIFFIFTKIMYQLLVNNGAVVSMDFLPMGVQICF